MKILVCISHVPDTTSKINFVDDDRAFDKNGIQFIINPNDEFGLTRAVWFQQKEQAEVNVITVGEASCEPTLRKCLAIGANRAFRVDLNPTDGFQVAQQLSAHCKEENYDLIIAGRESIDYNGAMVPGMLSAQMGYNFVTNCMGLEIEGSTAKAKREIDGGIESISCELPLVIGAQKGLVEEKDLIIPNMRMMQARQKSLTVLPPVDSQIKTTISKFEKPTTSSFVDEVIVPAAELTEISS